MDSYTAPTSKRKQAPVGEYRVRVYEVASGELEAVKNFAYGQFKELGYWLNDHEYIDKRYKVTITFSK